MRHTSQLPANQEWSTLALLMTWSHMRTAGHAACAASMQLHRPVSKGSLLQHLLGEGPLDIHDQLQHFIVGLAWEQNLASEQLIDDRAHAPDIQGVICSTRQGL